MEERKRRWKQICQSAQAQTVINTPRTDRSKFRSNSKDQSQISTPLRTKMIFHHTPVEKTTPLRQTPKQPLSRRETKTSSFSELSISEITVKLQGVEGTQREKQLAGLGLELARKYEIELEKLRRESKRGSICATNDRSSTSGEASRLMDDLPCLESGRRVVGAASQRDLLGQPDKVTKEYYCGQPVNFQT